METIYLIEYTSSDGQLKDFRLIEKIQGKWKVIGTLVGMEPSVLHGFESTCRGTEEKCWNVLHTWLTQGSEKYPVTWSGMLNVLKSVKLSEISRQLQEVLGKCLIFS